MITELAEALLSREGPASLNELAREVRASPEAVLELVMRLGGSVSVSGDEVVVSSRAEAAAELIRLGADPEVVSRRLSWRDFEGFAASALEEAGFRVWRNLRSPGRGGFEVDVVGVRAPYAVAVDCKRWAYRVSSPSRIAEAAAAQRRRSEMLAASWARLGLPGVVRVLVPALLVIRDDLDRFINGVAVVPVLRLRGFLEELESVAEDLGVRV